MIKEFADFDSLDRKLLWYLDQNSRESFSSLAKRVNRGSDTVRYRVLRFFESGFVHNAIPVVNAAALGFSTFKTYVKLRAKPARINAFIESLSCHEQLYWLAEWYGRWDLLFSMAAKSPAEFYEIRRELLEQYSDIIEEVDLAINTRVHRFPKNYLVNRKASESVQSGLEVTVGIDSIDRAVLREIASDARQTDVELARLIGSTPAIVRYRLQKLEQDNVIVSYRLQFDYRSAGILLFKLFITPEHPDRSVRDRLYAFSKENDSVTCFVEQLGSSPFELEVELPDYPSFHDIIDELRLAFDGSLRSIEFALLRNDHFHRLPFL